MNDQKPRIVRVDQRKYNFIVKREVAWLTVLDPTPGETYQKGDILYIDETKDEKKTGARVVGEVTHVEHVKDGLGMRLYVIGFRLERT